MLEAVKMRLTSKDVSGTMFTFEGTNIPEHLLLYIRSAFPNVEDVVNGDEEYVEWGETQNSRYLPWSGVGNRLVARWPTGSRTLLEQVIKICFGRGNPQSLMPRWCRVGHVLKASARKERL